jgi:cyclase
MKRPKVRNFCVIVPLMMAGSICASAQYNKPPETPEKGEGDAKLTTEFVKTGLYVISGGGSNSVLRLSGNGLILVDGKLPGNYDLLLKRINKISDQPVRVLIVTDRSESHNGDNTRFLAAGTRIIAQENAKPNPLGYVAPDDNSVSPIITYDREYKLGMGPIEVKLLHFGNAHSSGDTVVYFPNVKVVVVGDLFAAMPDPDYAAGGSLVGWVPVLTEILKLDFDVVVPSTGPTVTRADLEAFRNRIETLVYRASLLVKKGVPKEELMAQLETVDLGFRLSFTEPQLESFYAELSSAK